MSPAAQAKFLRVLQEREFQRLGGTRVLRTDARVVAATNRDLQRAMEQGAVPRGSLLSAERVRDPPAAAARSARRRPAAERGVSRGVRPQRSAGRPAGISRDARARLLEYHWPGNVRELRNILERAAILCDGGLITAEHLALYDPAPRVAAAAPARRRRRRGQRRRLAAPGGGRAARPATSRRWSATMIEQALQAARFNKSQGGAGARADARPALRSHAPLRPRVTPAVAEALVLRATVLRAPVLRASVGRSTTCRFSRSPLSLTFGALFGTFPSNSNSIQRLTVTVAASRPLASGLRWAVERRNGDATLH